jgi:hypothetical protein
MGGLGGLLDSVYNSAFKSLCTHDSKIAHLVLSLQRRQYPRILKLCMHCKNSLCPNSVQPSESHIYLTYIITVNAFRLARNMSTMM